MRALQTSSSLFAMISDPPSLTPETEMDDAWLEDPEFRAQIAQEIEACRVERQQWYVHNQEAGQLTEADFAVRIDCRE